MARHDPDGPPVDSARAPHTALRRRRRFPRGFPDVRPGAVPGLPRRHPPVRPPRGLRPAAPLPLPLFPPLLPGTQPIPQGMEVLVPLRRGTGRRGPFFQPGGHHRSALPHHRHRQAGDPEGNKFVRHGQPHLSCVPHSPTVQPGPEPGPAASLFHLNPAIESRSCRGQRWRGPADSCRCVLRPPVASTVHQRVLFPRKTPGEALRCCGWTRRCRGAIRPTPGGRSCRQAWSTGSHPSKADLDARAFLQTYRWGRLRMRPAPRMPRAPLGPVAGARPRLTNQLAGAGKGAKLHSHHFECEEVRVKKNRLAGPSWRAGGTCGSAHSARALRRNQPPRLRGVHPSGAKSF